MLDSEDLLIMLLKFAMLILRYGFKLNHLRRTGPSKLKNDKQVNPDSLYVEMGRAQAEAFMGDKITWPGISRQRSLASYNADAGKT